MRQCELSLIGSARPLFTLWKFRARGLRILLCAGSAFGSRLPLRLIEDRELRLNRSGQFHVHRKTSPELPGAFYISLSNDYSYVPSRGARRYERGTACQPSHVNAISSRECLA